MNIDIAAISGCLKDPSDKRDIPLGVFVPSFSLPDRIDYRCEMSPVRNQGSSGTCVAFASAVGMKEWQEQKECGKFVGLSPRYVYSFCKKYDGIPNEEGTFIRVAMKILAKKGVCTEECWPYLEKGTNKPQTNASRIAKKYRIKSYARVCGINQMERTLVSNGPFVAGVDVFEQWMEAREGKIECPPKSTKSLGGHAITIISYDKKAKIFGFKNSWGFEWGIGGYGFLPYEYMDRYCSDAWSSIDITLEEALSNAKGNTRNIIEEIISDRTKK